MSNNINECMWFALKKVEVSDAKDLGGIRELKLIKKHWDKFDLGNSKELVKHIERRLLELEKGELK
jgi:hypothetical protein